MEKIVETTFALPIPDAPPMGVFSASPEVGTDKGILVFQEAFGLNGHIREIVRRLAREGYRAAAPELFHRTAPPGFEVPYTDFESARPHFSALTQEGLVADAKALYAWLSGELRSDRIGSVGFCLGGYVSYLANARLPLKAAVSFYGTRILKNGLPLAGEQEGPLLLFWGGKDKGTPPEEIRALGDLLSRSGKDFGTILYPEAEHGFNCDERSNYHPDSARDAWARTLDLFQRQIP